MKKQLNPLQSLIDELSETKKLHHQLAKDAKNNAKSQKDYEYYHYLLGIENGFKQAIQMLGEFNFWNDACANSPKFDGWISIDDELPEPFKDVLCFYDGHYEIASYDGDEFYDAEERLVICTHWQYLPQAPTSND